MSTQQDTAAEEYGRSQSSALQLRSALQDRQQQLEELSSKLIVMAQVHELMENKVLHSEQQLAAVKKTAEQRLANAVRQVRKEASALISQAQSRHEAAMHSQQETHNQHLADEKLAASSKLAEASRREAELAQELKESQSAHTKDVRQLRREKADLGGDLNTARQTIQDLQQRFEEAEQRHQKRLREQAALEKALRTRVVRPKSPTSARVLHPIPHSLTHCCPRSCRSASFSHVSFGCSFCQY